VVDVDGQLLGRAARPLETVVSAPGRAEHDPRAWRAAALETGSEAVVQAGEIEVVAVGIGALGPAQVLVDAQLQPLDDAERMRPAVIERLFEATGLAEAGAPRLEEDEDVVPEHRPVERVLAELSDAGSLAALALWRAALI
jgi:sugar (pentulose or hexulose) kinase